MALDPTHLTGIQRSLDDLGTPLHDVTFCVVDLETTGGSAETCSITEIGAVKLCSGRSLGTFQTLVNPGCAIPPRITVLTGISESIVHTAPRIEEALAAFLEFLGGAVVVGHNVRFDLRFLDAALRSQQRPSLTNRSVDTCALARRLLGEEVPNHKLGTLASRLRLDHQPSHRALDDALATGDLLHVLIERATALGVTGLDDLLSLPTMAGHAQAKKLRLTDDLPRGPGVYLFKDRHHNVLYVGKATNLRARVRSYFSSDTRRKTGALLRETASLEHQPCHTPLEAAVREIRLIHQHQPRYNRQGKRRGRPTYVKLTLGEAFPRLSIVRQVRDDGALYVGPFGSHRAAAVVVDAIHAAAPLRRCTARPGRQDRPAACTAAQLGVATCPCSGAVTSAQYQHIIDRVVTGIESDHRVLLDPLADKMAELARAERFEEAADTRDRAAALSRALRRRQRAQQLRQAGRLIVEVPGMGGVELLAGQLVDAWGVDTPSEGRLALAGRIGPADESLAIDEALVVASWLHSHADRARLIHAEHGLSQSATPLPDFQGERDRAA